MKHSLLLAGLLLAGLAGAQPRKYVDVVTATGQQLAAVRARAQGGLSDENLHCTVQNLTRQELRLRLPSGLHFEAADAGAQDLFTYQEKLLVLKPRDSAVVKLEGFCMELHNYSPRPNTVYACRGLASKGLQPLGDSLRKYPALAHDYGQMFVWALSDNQPVYNVAVAPNLLRGATNVLRYLARVTGKSVARASAFTKGSPNVASVKTFAKRVHFMYHVTAAQPGTTLRVYGSDGRLVSELFKNRRLGPGVVNYTLGINMTLDRQAVALFQVRLLGPAGEVLKEMRVDEATPENDAEPTRQNFYFEFTLAKPVYHTLFRVRLPDGTLVEELLKRPYLPAGTHKLRFAFVHLYPPGTAFVARLENEDGTVVYQQPVVAAAP